MQIDREFEEEKYSIEELEHIACCVLLELKHAKLDKDTAEALNEISKKYNIPQIFNKPKYKKLADNNNAAPATFPSLPSHLAGEVIIGEVCREPCRKNLTVTDLDGGQQRLSLSKDHVEKFFKPMLKEEENLVKGIPVTVYDHPQGKGYEMMFKFWSGKMYVLTTPRWNQFKIDHALIPSQQVTVWLFRNLKTDNLCFAIALGSVHDGSRAH
ncbi:hypothetical protein COLO4_32232 [Corchorus olitorius]|uniref:TF-B3 domain-containing protein n=2 Tax=Corchorus olitorius TaxID=93759 RepID=A0A1R3H003_9ROSI|nr:hypothetical protein COLO4_32232 [Corchorus olitorius]